MANGGVGASRRHQPGKGIATGGGGLAKPKIKNPIRQIKGAAEKLAKKIYGNPDPENTPEWRARQRQIDTKKLQNVGARVRTGKIKSRG